MNIYLWAAYSGNLDLNPKKLIQKRYLPLQQNLWQDQQPQLVPNFHRGSSSSVIPYLKLFPYYLHIPIVYDLVTLGETEVILLSNVPLDEEGKPYPTLTEVWKQASSLQQIYWLWQIWQLWQPLQAENRVNSLLIPENLRVDGWRIRLLQLNPGNSSLSQLGESWLPFLRHSASSLFKPLAAMITQIQESIIDESEIEEKLQRLLLKEKREFPFRSLVVASDWTGNSTLDSQASYYPRNKEGKDSYSTDFDSLASCLMIICEDVLGNLASKSTSKSASYSIIQGIKLQIQNLWHHLVSEGEILTPEAIGNQLKTIIRVANNLIYNPNSQAKQEQNPHSLVMAWQLCQNLDGNNSHEVYLAHVGNSRAYWLTSNDCIQLTMDDNLGNQSVIKGKALYGVALNHKKAKVLSQALVIQPGELLEPHVQRFVVTEAGVLLLCSHSLAELHLVEMCWQDIIPDVLTGQVSLEEGVNYLLQLAQHADKTGHFSVVATAYFLSPQDSVVINWEQKSNNDVPDYSQLIFKSLQ